MDPQRRAHPVPQWREHCERGGGEVLLLVQKLFLVPLLLVQELLLGDVLAHCALPRPAILLAKHGCLQSP